MMEVFGNRCPLCGSIEVKHTAHPLYNKCLYCGLVFQYRDIRPVEDYYDELGIVPDYRAQRPSYRTYLSIVEEHIDILDDVYVVDVGGGDATLLELVKGKLATANIYAIEQSHLAQENLRNKGITVIQPEMMRDIKPKLVFACQVIEHIAQPFDFLKSLHLANGDHLVLTSPATDTIFYSKNGRYWKSFSPSYHLMLYNQRSINYLFGHCGLKLEHYEHCYSGSNVFNVQSSVQKYLKSLVIWSIRVLLKGFKPIPRYHGKNSFLAIAVKNY